MTEAEADALLARDPASLSGLIGKGDWRLADGDERAAVSYYRAALRAAAALGAPPSELAPELARIERLLARSGDNFRAHLEASLAAAGLGPDRVGARFADALAIVFQEKEARIELQRPSQFYFPGLPQRAFFEREEFPWAADLESATDDIREELIRLLASEDGFRPYVEREPNRPHRDFHGLHGDPSWSAYYLIDAGIVQEEHAARCPRTMAALAKVPLCGMPGRTPSVHFSLLRPGAHIPPHWGMLNTRLICHLPLIVPAGCGLRVDQETRTWDDRKLLIFDDSIRHEAWNRSDELRAILLFDIWRPELDELERKAIATMFRAIDSYRAR